LLAERGAKVVVNDLGGAVDGSGGDASVAQAVVNEIVGRGGDAVANSSSVVDPEGAESIVAAAVDHFGRIDIVVTSVGILLPREFPDTTLDEMERESAVHVGGTFNVCRAAWPHMVEARYGRIVMTGSGSFMGAPYLIPYGTAKAGVFGLMRALAVAGFNLGIKVNVVNPVSDATRMAQYRYTHRQTLNDAPPAERERRTFTKEPGEVSPVVCVLAHEQCPATGEMYGSAGGRVHRYLIAETVGFDKRGHTPEELLYKWSQVQEEAGYSGTPIGEGRSVPDSPRPTSRG
jgi:NAD(P)-dependent dehydrogenase (short-subunit alcohol dehydrogenase family)